MTHHLNHLQKRKTIMELQHIEIENLKKTTLNVRKNGKKDIADLLPSIRSLGILQPLLVRPNCEGFEIVAGQRRFHSAMQIKKEDGTVDPLPCIIMEAGDDAKAIEASLAENIARLPMDEIDQYKAFAALIKESKSVAEIADQFGITERLVEQRLAIANLINPILTLYRKDDIGADTVRALTMATKRQQKSWLSLYQSEDEYAPLGRSLREWLFGGVNIPVSNALFDVADYKGSIISDLFGDERYFSDSEKFWPLQNTAIATAKERYLADGWVDVVILEIVDYWSSWEHSETSKKDGGKIYVQATKNGEITFHEGYLTQKEAVRLEKALNGEEPTKCAERPELTKAMQNYLDLHRHSAVRRELLNHTGIALRLTVAQIIAGSSLWETHADPQKACKDAISQSLAQNKAEGKFAEERKIVRDLLGGSEDAACTIVPTKNEWQRQNDLYSVFAKLIALDDDSVTRILTFVVAETLPCGNAMVEALGKMLSVDMASHWQVDDAFFDLLRDKEAINAILKQVGGKRVADGNISTTAKVQKQIVRDYLDGNRNPHNKDWQPRYMTFPMGLYTKRSGIDAVNNWNGVKGCFA
jgi:ParB family transcriptional regulator, chromosome partitioning protein